MSAITTHVLDTAAGRPATGVPVRLELHAGERGWMPLAHGVTGPDGRLRDLLAEGGKLDAGRYRLIFDTGAYLGVRGAFFPEVTVVFEVRDPNEHYHVPLLLSPFGYSTYRGS
ncbi:MAG TPA: hydroxyisourate hydrolase [Candidatus Limnocylindria bacterium]|nr:hydroxyisourate hydrolase [Candidatus Limnocylindria bacterium]